MRGFWEWFLLGCYGLTVAFWVPEWLDDLTRKLYGCWPEYCSWSWVWSLFSSSIFLSTNILILLGYALGVDVD